MAMTEDCAAAALVSPGNQPKQHPLDAFRREWNGSNKEEKEAFDYSEYRESMLCFLDTLSNLGACTDIYNPRRTVNCQCLANLDLTEEEAVETVDYLISFFKLSFEEQQTLVLEWK